MILQKFTQNWDCKDIHPVLWTEHTLDCLSKTVIVGLHKLYNIIHYNKLYIYIFYQCCDTQCDNCFQLSATWYQPGETPFEPEWTELALSQQMHAGQTEAPLFNKWIYF